MARSMCCGTSTAVPLATAMNASMMNESGVGKEGITTLPHTDWTRFAYLIAQIVGMLLTVGCNLLTITVILARQRLRTVTNHFVVSLCSANLLFGVSLGYRIAYFASQSGPLSGCKYCCLVRFAVLLVPAFATIYGLVAITIDRYVAVFHPLRYACLMSRRRVLIIMISIWTLSIVSGCIPLVWNHWTQPVSQCEFIELTPPVYILVFMVGPAFLVAALLLYVYVRIWMESCRQLRRIAVLSGQKSSFRKEMRTTITIGLVVISYVLALLPYFTVLLLIACNVSSPALRYTYSISLIFAIVNPIVNPLIYVWRTRHFSVACRAIFCRTLEKEDDQTVDRPRLEVVVITADNPGNSSS